MAGNAGMEHLIPMVNKLQDAFAQTGGNLDIDLPQIAVVGGQSAGKSSVLENFVGRDFLPRGSGIVTRRPLVLQLINEPRGEWGTFLHDPKRTFTDFNEIRKEIEAETDRETGSNKGISRRPINLQVHSPHVLNLTLVDLPGLTKVPVGDQPADIEQQIKGMIAEYVSKDNCLILAVSPANTDLANSDALKIAKEFDPQGTRTIGVITKLDLMDEGTDARNILENKHLPLRRGYVGVVNRSQKDITQNKDIRAALSAERQYFLQHPAYRHMVDRMGTGYLQKKLNEQLTAHIKATLPQLKKKLQGQLNEIEKDVQSFKHLQPNDPSSKMRLMMKMVQNVNDNFVLQVEGTGASLNENELLGGAKINMIFHQRFNYQIQKLKTDEKQLRKEIKLCIQNVRAIRSGLFTPDQAFEEVARGQIKKLIEPALWCVEAVGSELTNILRDCSEAMKTHPMLREETDRIVTEHVKEQEVRTKDMMQTVIDTELAYIDTHHPDFVGNVNATVQQTRSRSNDQSKSKTRTVEHNNHQMLKKGWLVLHSKGVMSGSKEFWFVLDTDTLTWYKNETQDEKRYAMSCEGLSLKEVEKGGFTLGSSKPSFVLFNENGRNVWKDSKSIELAAENEDILDDWKHSLLRAGVHLIGETVEENADKKSVGESDVINFDPTLDKRVENIRNLVDSYLSIIRDHIKDIVPKIIMTLMVNNTKEFLRTEIQAHIYSANAENLMQEAPEEQERRDVLLNMYKGLKDALHVLGNLNLMKTEPAPPPVVDNRLSYSSSPTLGGRSPTFGGGYTSSQPNRSVSPNRRPPPMAPQRPNYQSGPPQMPSYQSGPPQMPSYQSGPPQMNAPPIPNRPGSGMRKPILPKRPSSKPTIPQRPR